MDLKIWHLLVVGALAVTALAVVRVGRDARDETNTVAFVAATMPGEMAKRTAAANVRSTIPSLEAFYAEHGTYAGATLAALRAIDTGLDPTVELGWVQSGRYCLESTVDGQTASVTGPGGEIVLGGC
jgi:hypothetical protein